jgi:hypothetical protein
VAKFLIEHGCLLKTKVESPKRAQEIPLLIGARWNHPNIVSYLLSQSLYDKKTVNSALNVTSSSIVKDSLSYYMQDKGFKKGSFCECYCMCKFGKQVEIGSSKVQPVRVSHHDYRDEPMHNVDFLVVKGIEKCGLYREDSGRQIHEDAG